jgi:hypothetical protein
LLSTPRRWFLSPVIRLLWTEVSLLALTEIGVETRVSHNVAEDFQALADQLSALPDVWVEHVQVAHVVVRNVAGASSHPWWAAQPLNEALVALLNGSPNPFAVLLW